MTISEWFPTVAGQRVNSRGGIKGECVALSQKYANEVLGVSGAPVFPVEVAAQMGGARPDAFTWVKNTPKGIPPYGSIVVFGAPTGGIVTLSNGQRVYAGHTGVAIEGCDLNNVRIIQQNDPFGSGVSIKIYPYTNVIGWLVPKTNQTNTPPSGGGDDMVVNGENEFARMNQLHVQLLGRPLGRDVFNSLVGKSWLTVIEIFSDHAETQARQQQYTVMQQQIAAQAEQIKQQQADMASLAEQVKDLQAKLAVQTDDTKLLNGFGELLQKVIIRLGLKK